ncbi:MAG: hypothetical protein IJ764_00445 [Bacteroidales bacterium]|nr:hypothetical protein [Bacteroidales bacterium]
MSKRYLDISGLTYLWAKIKQSILSSINAANLIPASTKGQPGGVAPLNDSGLIDADYLPSYVDDVIIVAKNPSSTGIHDMFIARDGDGQPIEPESGKIYVLDEDATLDLQGGNHATNGESYAAESQFRWTGARYVKLADGGVRSMTDQEIDDIIASVEDTPAPGEE